MSVQVPQPLSDEHVFLIGRPPIEEYLGFLVVSANGQNLDRRALMDEWRLANDHLKMLEQQEAGWPDHPQVGDIPPHLHSLRRRFLPIRCFNAYSTSCRPLLEWLNLIAL